MSEIVKEPWLELRELLETGGPPAVEAFFERLPTGEVGRTLLRLAEDEQRRVLQLLSPKSAAGLLEQLPESQAADLLEYVRAPEAAAIVEELPSDERADIIRDVESPEAEAILAEMTPDEARETRELSRYRDDVAGGLMITEYLTYPQDWTVGAVIQDIRTHADLYRDYDVQYAYVTHSKVRLAGVVRLRDLLLGREATPIRDLMISHPVVVRDHDSLDQLRDLFDEHHFLAVPVVDAAGRLLGVVRAAAVEEALGERGDRQYLQSQGIVGGDELRTMPLPVRTRRRLSWLSVNILLNIAAASVIALYQDTLAAVIALAVFLPIISDMSGCSGNQAVAVSIRELALGLLRPHEWLRVWLGEISVGVVNGIVLGALVAAAAWLWKGNPFLGLVVGVALAANTLVAVSIGGLIPLGLKGLKMDPALASGPILTTITDMCGFFLVLSLASAMMPWLVR